ncbi:MAG TPA: indolepyruvate oxidoreductase subunit beta [Candidatus Competibacteraceae bacterium]|nr:indolepyruvate oxidoreductase subunit beta [Candidatus Competibacteraceae bacterium]HQA26227.1 indolepyruvate oxidoreductase subunit beta [Candidatus Competibacteraceae bacterium]HQD56791.1 indolepyruvate oxidoreductase subunit beta [Candidatus Competibacteraceae bacterium]
MRDGIINILVVGIGGQGVMTAAEMLARTALNQGYDVKKTEVAGMAQRGGVVSSHVRFGPRIYSPQIDAGEADLLIGFEAAEALRWLPWLRPTGVAMVNTLRIAPPVVSVGLYDYPADPIGQLAASGVEVHAFDAGAIAEQLGNPKLVNSIMLGAISDHLPFPADVLKTAIIEGFRAYKPKLAEVNAQAFDAGRQAGHADR